MSILIVSYNTRQMTLDCLASVYDQTDSPIEVIVVDNASTDGSAEAIAEAFPQVTLLAETTNHGFAAAHAVATPHATAPYLLLLNPDTVVLDHALDNLLAFAKRTPEAGIWGGRTLFGDRSLNITSCWTKMSLWSLFTQASGLASVFRGSPFFNPESIPNWKRDTERAVDVVTGCLFMMRRDMWDALGGFDPAFVMYGEEVDLCLRATDQMGAAPRITPAATIIHYGGASEAVRTDKMVRLMRAKIALVNRHFPGWQAPVGMTILRRWPWSRALALRLVASVTGKDSHKAKAQTWSEIWARRDEWQDGYPLG